MKINPLFLMRYVVCLGSMVVISIGCMINSLIPNRDFPEREIVFEHLTGGHPSSDLGFIHSDGSGLITRTIHYYPYPHSGYMPTWSPDGQLIALQVQSNEGSQRVLSGNGVLKGECRNWLWREWRTWVTAQGDMLFTLRDPDNNRESVVLGDLQSCRIKKELFAHQNVNQKMFLDFAHLSSQGWLAVSLVEYDLEKEDPVDADIVVMSPDVTQPKIIAHGRSPTWSPDGEWLAYTTLDGIYIVHKDGNQSQKIVDLNSRSEAYPGTTQILGWYVGFPTPSWSPDGEWLVYHRMTTNGPYIYKINIASGKEVEIFQGGIYPDWRWDTDFME